MILHSSQLIKLKLSGIKFKADLRRIFLDPFNFKVTPHKDLFTALRGVVLIHFIIHNRSVGRDSVHIF